MHMMGTDVGPIDDFCEQLLKLTEVGPAFSYHVANCHVIATPGFPARALETFEKMDVEVLEGHRLLGSVIGPFAACQDHSNDW